MAHGNQLSQEEFIRRGREMHGDKYTYKKVVYEGCNPKVMLGCRTCRTWFTTRARTHIRKGSLGGCKLCGDARAAAIRRKKSTDAFTAKVQAKFGKRAFNYIDECKSYYAEFGVICNTCNTRFTTNQARHLNSRFGGCPNCAREGLSKSKMSLDTAGVVSKLKEKFGNKYTYRKVVFTGMNNKVTIGCKECRIWFDQRVYCLLKGKGCPECRGEANSTRSFIKRAVEIHGNDYDYSKVVYVKSRVKVEIKCNECLASFMQTPNSHLNSSGCPHCCRPYAHSKLAIKWLEYEAQRRGITIQHARNGGEVRIEGTRYRADGFHAESRTVFEFYGDIFHGNPQKFKPRSKPNPYTSKTAGALYRETMKREEVLKGLGYSVVSMWQSDFYALRRKLRKTKV